MSPLASQQQSDGKLTIAYRRMSMPTAEWLKHDRKGAEWPRVAIVIQQNIVHPQYQ